MGLDTVELVMSFEKEFGIKIPNAAAAEMVRVGNVVDFFVAELARSGRPCGRDQVFARVQRLTAEIGNLDPRKIRLESRFVDDLDLD